jgi:uncharacterized protein YqgC (DUF456 family)
MDIVLIISGIVLMIAGVAGCIVPGLPGPPLNFLALICISFVSEGFDAYFYILWGTISVIVLLLDYYLPVWVSKKFGATRSGIIGGVIGMIAGIFFTPLGMILGLVVGSVLGDMAAGKNISDAMRSGLGSAFGTLFSVGIKLLASVWMSWIFISELMTLYVSE